MAVQGFGFTVEGFCAVLGGSGALISRVISRVTILITHIRGLITPLITTPEPPSRVYVLNVRWLAVLGLEFGLLAFEFCGVWALCGDKSKVNKQAVL